MTPLRIGRPATTFVVAPHPDDETIGAYGLIRRLRLAGRRVGVLVVTDGAASHPNSPAWPRRRLVAERRRETRRVLARIGVAADMIRFLGLPDGALPGLDRRRAVTIARAVARVPRLALLVGPCASDAHPDHRAVAAALARAPAARRLSYLVWPDRGHARRGPSHTLPLGSATPGKRSAIRGYRTQMGAITDDPGGFTIAPHEFRAFARPVELYREERRCARSR